MTEWRWHQAAPDPCRTKATSVRERFHDGGDVMRASVASDLVGLVCVS